MTSSLLSLALLSLLEAAPMVQSAGSHVIYHETFPDYRDPTRYTRIAQACKDWQILTGPDGIRFMRVTVAPTAGRLRALILWDLPPIQFDRFAVEVRVNDTGGAPVYLESAAGDRDGSAFFFKTYGETGGGAKRTTLPTDGTWARYGVAIPGDLTKILTQGKEVSPYVHGPGDALTSWEGVDFSNRGFTALYFHADVPPGSPLIGKTYTIDFRLLELLDTGPPPKP